MITQIGKSVSHLAKLKKSLDRHQELEKISEAARNFQKKHKKERYAVNCDACNSSNLSDWTNILGFNYSKCKDCGLIFLNPRYGQKALNDYYSSKDYAYNRYQVKKIDKKLLNIKIQEIMKSRYEFISKFGDFKSWIDLGTGNAEFVYAISNFFNKKIKIIGVEPNGESVQYAKDNFHLDIVQDDVINYISSHEFPYDIITMFGLLEHLADPSYVLGVLNKKMMKGSFLALLLPVGESLSSFFQRKNPELAVRHLVPPCHVTLWNEKSIRVFLNRNGFEVEGIWKYGQDCFELYHMLASQLDEAEKNLLLNSMDVLQEAIDKAGLGDEMLIVARKK